ncbi:MAG: hypothetical protein OXF56_24020 [Rhodobacteraceae bacterium]|nr:hypothetical protein [Paracoccaceae bacterium]
MSSPADVFSEDLDDTARRWQPCPDGQHGFGILQERPYIRRVRGNRQSEFDCTSSTWLETSHSCFADVVRDVIIAEQCPAPQPGFILHRVEQRIEKHPANPYGFRVWRQETSADKEISDTCGIDGRRLNTATSEETGQRTRSFSVAHPSTPPWNGDVQETRIIRVVRSWFGDGQDAGIERRYPGAWTQQSENCSRDRTRAASRRTRRTCPSTHPNGDSYLKDTGTETYREFLSGAAELTVLTVWNENWVLTTNNCYRTWTSVARTETRTSGCNRQKRTVTDHWREWERNPGNDQLVRTEATAWRTTGTVAGCGEREDIGRSTGVDIDRDGDIDKTLSKATEDEKRRGEIITKRDDDLTPDDFRDDNDDNDDSGGGGLCFLTTAVVELSGVANDGPTLTTLRNFRDGWLAETEEGRALIADYYVLAPRIVSAIPEGHAEWTWIAEQVDAARDAIFAGLNVEALAIYAGIIRRLQERWL